MAEDARREIMVWDLPTRLFHWLLAVAVAGAWWSGDKGDSETHALFGYAVLALILFRLTWGFFGSETARFSHFLAGPSAAIGHLRHLFRRGKIERTVGHNPLGGYAVALLLLSVLIEAVTGLFLYDDEFYWGPLNGWVSEVAVERLERIHILNMDLLLIFVGIHVLAVAFYGLVKGLDLLRPMLTGRAELPETTMPPRTASPLLALFLFALAGFAVWALVRFA